MSAKIRRIAGRLGALVLAGLLMFVLGVGTGPIPALGRALDPARGAWASADGGRLPAGGRLHVPGLTQQAQVSFDNEGLASITAASDDDLFRAQGYVTARFRLTQMDLLRRLGSGRLAELSGPAAVESDTFELQLGLRRTAEAAWTQTPADSPAGKALSAYTAGVNARIAELEDGHDWPALYGLTGVHPGRWTPVDSLVVQEVLTQQLDFSTVPLGYALLDRSLGPELTKAWFPVLPATPQQPYDPGPYQDLGTAPIPERNANAADPAALRPGPGPAPTAQPLDTAHAAAAATAVLARADHLPAGALHLHPDSNAWAANGPAVAGGRAMLAGDPHLQLSLPSDWFEIALRSPGLDVTGASLPGMPAVLIGHNEHISWSLTDVQNQSTLFYSETTSPEHPGAYYWNGAWRPLEHVEYTIPVRGGDPVPLTVDLTVHGPVITRDGQTTSVDWMGNIPSPDLAALLSISTAGDYGGFREALRGWKAPTQNFVYADDQGNIGIVAPGYYPLVKSGEPWLPLSGEGAADVAGTIPFDAVPQVYNPPSHAVVTANQRPVGADYPYYIGTTQDFDPGYRATQINTGLRAGPALGPDDFGALQSDVTDRLAAQLVPELLKALDGAPLDERQRTARDLLTGWNAAMDEKSPQASIWWRFLIAYLGEVFQPWWTDRKVPVDLARRHLALERTPPALVQDLEQWTLHDQGNPAFTPPGGPARDARAAMRDAFAKATAGLAADLGPDPASWNWGRLHRRVIPSITQVPALGHGPLPAGGDPWTANNADGGMDSDFGPSWRMVVRWTGPATADARAVYPGGQSENPASPWYRNLIDLWWRGEYLPLRTAAEHGSDDLKWTLTSEG
ncbi:penicillin acylase family protein [Kitasatospora aureofaciens]|uniref:penicillin acylase family protein n=1 Tax=Kitasatospora aureofaciens TaxID=1894 RepID=UPI001C47CEA0|nr:penicillin acylase family protein [Kitasatospora aureofaciens]MBV6699792.1 penicillin acylase family protein [Kitasatospora aureofaciens]